MRDKSPALTSHVRKFVGSLVAENTGSKMVLLGADADTLDGLNPHMVIIDELHAHTGPGPCSTSWNRRWEPAVSRCW
jgi:phage terminase large subunit-like protein